MNFLAAGAAFARTFGEKCPDSCFDACFRADFTDHFAGIPAQIRWLDLEQWSFEVRKNDENHFGLDARDRLGRTADRL